MNGYELKEYIIKNDKILHILEAIGCFKIKPYSKEYRCGSPNHDNTTSISIKKDSLKVKIYGKDENKIKGDLYTLVMDVKALNFPQSIKYIHELLGLEYKRTIKIEKKECKIDILRVFKKALREYSDYTDEELLIYKEDICSEFIKMPYIGWVQEGILPKTQKLFGIGYSRKHNRIVIPHRHWCGEENDYVGIIGRTLIENYDMFDIPKYFPLQKFPKSMNIYGLQENYHGIQKASYVTVFEAEKSTLKRHSKKDYTGVSLGGHELSKEQAKILISLDVDIIIAFDKDISLEHIKKTCDMFYGIRPIYYIYDEYGLLKNKQSPADANEKIYQVLFNRKIKYEREVN